MNIWTNTILTDKGRALMAKLTQGTSLEITRAVTGAGFVTPGLLAKATDVSDPKQELTFRQVAYPETGKCAITAMLRNDNLDTGYTATQVGMFATDPDEGEILFFISQATDAQTGTIVPSYSEMPGFSTEWTFYFQYGQADSVHVTVDPSNSVTPDEMKAYVAKEVAAGRTMAGDINMDGHKISNVAEPTSGSDVATRHFVEQHTIEGNTYVAVDYEKDGNVVLKPYVADEDELTFKSHMENTNNPHAVLWSQIGAYPASRPNLSNVDLNEYIGTKYVGVYWCQANCANAPFGSQYHLEVFPSLQRATQYSTGKIKTRSLINLGNGSVWTEWKEPNDFYNISVSGAISCQTVADAITNGTIPVYTAFVAKVTSNNTNPAQGVAVGSVYGSGPHSSFIFMHYGNNTLYKCRLAGTELTIKEL